MSKLERTLSFIDIYLFAIGYIIGAGIFILIGKVSKSAKKLSWLSFLLAGICALLISTSYIDLTYINKSNFGEAEIIKKVFGKYSTIFYTILVICIGVFVNSTVALSIGEAISKYVLLKPAIVATILIVLFAIINSIGMKFTAIYNHASTLIEIGALLVIVFFGYKQLTKKGSSASVSGSASNIGFSTLIYTALLAMFAYSGFEVTIKLTEEAKDPNDIPKAIIASIVTAIGIYILVSVVATRTMGSVELGKSSFPMSTLSKKLIGATASIMFLFIGVISISNTLLVSQMGTARVFHSIGRDIPKLNWLSYVNKYNKTPSIATGLVAILSIVALYFKNIEKLAAISSCLIFLLFVILNAAIFLMYFDKEAKKRLEKSWTHPINNGMPILPAIAFIVSICILIVGCYYSMNTAF